MTAQQLSPNGSNSVLCQLIAQQITNSPNQRITFADYMELALYHPQQGYYSTKAVTIGAQGDFFTSPHLGADFGELLAEQFVDMWRSLGQPSPFTLVEMGAGQGLLATDILQYLQQQYPDFLQAIEYVVVEKSPTLRLQQQQRLRSQSHLTASLSVRWCTWEEIPPDSIVGCCFSNELVDAFPVHQVVLTEGELQEVYVTLTSSPSAPDTMQFAEVLGELSTPQLREYFDWLNIPLLSGNYPEGYRTEVNLAALSWLQTVADRLQQGYLLTIDYGYPATRYYNPARSEGTLQCYYQHSYHNNPYFYVGYQDITAHVDFTALERQGDRCGLQQVGLIQQGLFLMTLGLGDRIAALSHTDLSQPGESLQALLARREALHALASPMGLGNFNVLIQSKGLGTSEQQKILRGLSL
ncbi:class I SAM-dependent methyltransferase [Trichocoleus sp. FACHB-262]|uniref:class I SAM-dependent methyltransferase n=1 Tax=Trichocoleus sp. FACHB-262 TaxID=2692869 RepID=UPI0016881326|nr:class I SAM-dependent methyltransferase [Trichocoleus sp. FACHB-262]MBD2123994.1 class I SAM-dependent methyltransferase [Trichocoleus sp. FACHB-262]